MAAIAKVNLLFYSDKTSCLNYPYYVYSLVDDDSTATYTAEAIGVYRSFQG